MWRSISLILVLALLAYGAEEELLFVKKSEFAGKVLVVQSDGFRIMRFRDEGQDSEQSRCEVKRPNHLVHEYTRLQLLGLAFLQQPPRKILVIGLGGGSLSKALHALYPRALVDSVEIDPVVVQAARKFFFYREGPGVRTFVEDAAVYVKRANEKYDIIFLDAFDGLDVPLPLRTEGFYKSLERILAPGGVVVANLHRNCDTYANDRNTLAAVFGRTVAFGGLGNVLLVNTVEPGPVDPAAIEQAARSLTPEYDLVRYARQLDPSETWDKSAPIVR